MKHKKHNKTRLNLRCFLRFYNGSILPFLFGVLVAFAFVYVVNSLTATKAQTAFTAEAYAATATDAPITPNSDREPIMPDDPTPAPRISKPAPLMELVEIHDWSGFDWKVELATPYVDCGLSEDVQDYLYIMCLDLGIDYSIALGWIQLESLFDPNSISPTNDWGLTQINICNHKWLEETLGITDFLDPYQSIRAGLFVLRHLYDKYDSTNCALMAYNLGETGARRLWNTGVWETAYTRNIMKNAAAWREVIGNSP